MIVDYWSQRSNNEFTYGILKAKLRFVKTNPQLFLIGFPKNTSRKLWKRKTSEMNTWAN